MLNSKRGTESHRTAGLVLTNLLCMLDMYRDYFRTVLLSILRPNHFHKALGSLEAQLDETTELKDMVFDAIKHLQGGPPLG